VAGINPNFDGRCPNRPLVLAARWGHYGIVELLLAEANIDPNARDHQDATPLLHACYMGHIDIVRRLLLRYDVDPGFVGWTPPLQIAISLGYTVIIDLLLARDDSDLNLYNDDRDTALMMAIKMRSVEW
jgi:ankyrin repeat protein